MKRENIVAKMESASPCNGTVIWIMTVVTTLTNQPSSAVSLTAQKGGEGKRYKTSLCDKKSLNGSLTWLIFYKTEELILNKLKTVAATM